MVHPFTCRIRFSVSSREAPGTRPALFIPGFFQQPYCPDRAEYYHHAGRRGRGVSGGKRTGSRPARRNPCTVTLPYGASSSPGALPGTNIGMRSSRIGLSSNRQVFFLLALAIAEDRGSSCPGNTSGNRGGNDPVGGHPGRFWRSMGRHRGRNKTR